MANISNLLNKIKTATFGKEVRGALADGLAAVNRETENTTAKQEHLEETFDQLIINAGNSNAEIVDARVDKNTGQSYEKIGDRLDNVSSQLEHIELKNNGKPISVELFGLIGDGITDNTEKLKSALTQCKNLYFPKGVYNIKLVGNDFFVFTDLEGINLLGDGTIFDTTEYTRGETLRNIFKFIRCKDINVTINYNANEIDDWQNNIGYVGASFLYFEDNCKNIDYKGVVNNARYGVRSGDYLLSSSGYCSKFKIDITTTKTGYPVALYLADNIDANVCATDIHRACYLAGCENVRGNIDYKGFIMASGNVLFTNSITSPHNSDHNLMSARGCSNINLNITEKEAYSTKASGAITCISIQWLCPTNFNNINLNINADIEDSNRVESAFAIFSRLKTLYPDISGNWEKFINIRDVRITGVIDRAKQTLSNKNSWGDIYIEGYDVTLPNDVEKCPTIENLDFENFKVLYNDTTEYQHTTIKAPQLINTLTMKNCALKDMTAELINGTLKFQNTKLNFLAENKCPKILSENSKIVGITNGNTITPLLQNGWTNFGEPFGNLAIELIGNRVYVNGMIKGGVTSDHTVLFYLNNAKLYPKKAKKFIAMSDTGLATVNVSASGSVVILKIPTNTISNGWLLLDFSYTV